MILKIQILSLIYSFFYGIGFFLLLEINYKFLYEGKLVYRIIISFLFVIFISLLYFVILLKINSGILHIYFFLSIFTGYLSSFLIYNKLIVKNKKVWYNVIVEGMIFWLRLKRKLIRRQKQELFYFF